MRKSINLIGQKFYRLTVLSFAGRDKYGTAIWNCVCDCGNAVTTRGSSLKSGHTKSCGCFQREKVSNIFSKHKDSDSRLYAIWRDMKHRCTNSSIKSWSSYGGKGIAVCDEWKENYMPFKEWALENGYADNLTIDRINVNGNYEPSNCRWATKKKQANNRSTNKRLDYKGKDLTITQWSEITGIGPKTIECRLKRGWSIEMTLSTPTNNKTNQKG